MVTIEEIKTHSLVLYTGDRADIKHKVGELIFGITDKSGKVLWIFKAIEGIERDKIIVHPKNLSLLDKEEVERMRIKLSSTKINSAHKKRKIQNERIARQRDEFDE